MDWRHHERNATIWRRIGHGRTLKNYSAWKGDQRDEAIAKFYFILFFVFLVLSRGKKGGRDFQEDEMRHDYRGTGVGSRDYRECEQESRLSSHYCGIDGAVRLARSGIW